jgi:ribosomal protein S18 acetylase RimI-like enzyme
MEEIERVGRNLGLKNIGLNVFAHNKIARGLYEKLGYKEKAIIMVKEL